MSRNVLCYCLCLLLSKWCEKEKFSPSCCHPASCLHEARVYHGTKTGGLGCALYPEYSAKIGIWASKKGVRDIPRCALYPVKSWSEASDYTPPIVVPQVSHSSSGMVFLAGLNCTDTDCCWVCTLHRMWHVECPPVLASMGGNCTKHSVHFRLFIVQLVDGLKFFSQRFRNSCLPGILGQTYGRWFLTTIQQQLTHHLNASLQLFVPAVCDCCLIHAGRWKRTLNTQRAICRHLLGGPNTFLPVECMQGQGQSGSFLAAV